MADELEKTGKKVLLFGFDDLNLILAVQKALEPFGAELVPVGKRDHGKTLAVLTGVSEEIEPGDSGTVPERMAVLCGLTEQLDELLPALNAAGAGGCLKAALTRYNINWSAARLYTELSMERDAIRKKNQK